MNIINDVNNILFNNKNIKKHTNIYNILYFALNHINEPDQFENTNKVISTKCQDFTKRFSKPEFFENENPLWYIFIMKNGIDEYNLLKKKHTIESKFRYSLVDMVKENKKLLRANKVKVDDVVNDLGNLGNITIESVKAIAICMRLNLCIKKNKVCQVCRNNDDDAFYVIESTQMKIDTVTSKYIEDNYYEVANIDKPFKSVSSYKVADLKDICDKLEVLTLEDKNGTKKLKKNDYYMRIMEHIS